MALEAIRGELTMAQLVTKHGVHQTLISAWKRQAVDGLAGVFSAKAEVAEDVREGELEKLHATIGQLVVERDFLRQASGPIAAAPSRRPLLAGDERRSAARDDRAAAPQAGDRPAVRAASWSISGAVDLGGSSRRADCGPLKGESPLNLSLMRLPLVG